MTLRRGFRQEQVAAAKTTKVSIMQSARDMLFSAEDATALKSILRAVQG